MATTSATSATETPQPGQRTFDCPWCGSINKIPTDHLGEHYTCPECQKATKLTDKNTSTLPTTAPPPDAPHLSGDRTFDCPWCGAISSVPSEHLGEHFTCAECHKQTKLTPQNTRRAPMFEPPPDAPPPEWDGARARRLKVLLGVAVLAGVGIALAVSGGGDAPKDGGGTPTVRGSDLPPPTPPPDVPPTPVDGRNGAMASQPPDVVKPPDDVPPAPTPEALAAAQALVDAEGRFAAAGAKHAAAQQMLLKARQRVDEWKKNNPGVAAAEGSFRALGEVEAERRRLLEGKARPLPVGDARAIDAEVAAYVEKDPARVKVADTVLAWLRADLFGRHAVGAASWKDLDFQGAGFERAAGVLLETLRAQAASVPPDLDAVVGGAEKAVEDAMREVTEAERAMLRAKSAAEKPR